MKDFFQHRTSAQTRLIRALNARLPAASIISDQQGCSAYATRGLADAGDAPLAVILAQNIDDVQAAVRICYQQGVPVLPRGAGTNLSCAVSPSSDEVIVCTSRMRKISDFDSVSGTLRVEAGVRNQAVSDHVADASWYYAPDPSSRRNCTIGGNIATNSGGSSCLHSGVTVNHIAGLTVVLNDGSVMTLGGEAYDADGLDLASVMCGAEGRMGIVVEAILRLSPSQPARCAMMIELNDPGMAQGLGAEILACDVDLAQMDYMDAHATALCEALTPVGYPSTAGGIILVDLLGDAERLERALAKLAALADRHGVGFALYRGAEEAVHIWQGRERVYGAMARVSQYVATDIAVPLSKLTATLETVERCVKDANLDHATTAHLGDGTVHSFIFHDAESSRSKAEACAIAIRKAAIGLGGTVTSEYGIGAKHMHLLQDQFTRSELVVQDRCVDAMQGIETVPTRLTDKGSEALIYTPETEHEVASILCDPATGPFQLTGQNPAREMVRGAVLSAGALRGIVRQNPPDQTVTVLAGTPLAELKRYLGAHGQRLTFDIPQAPCAVTVGGAVARNLATSRRPFEGSVRDAVLGTRCVTGLGEVIATGGQVLKNAAGLDLSKALAGTLGANAFITEVTLRVVPLSHQEQTGVFLNVSAGDFPAQIVKLMQAGWDITGAAHLSAQVTGGLGLGSACAMVIRVKSGFAMTKKGTMILPTILSKRRAEALWDTLSFRDVFASCQTATKAMITCKPSTGGVIAARLNDLRSHVAMDWRGGLVCVGLAPDLDREFLDDIVQDYTDADLHWLSGQDNVATCARFDPLKSALDPLGRFVPAPSFSDIPNLGWTHA